MECTHRAEFARLSHQKRLKRQVQVTTSEGLGATSQVAWEQRGARARGCQSVSHVLLGAVAGRAVVGGG